MPTHYDIVWLNQQVYADQALEYLFFWGHSNPEGAAAGNFCLSQWYPSPFSLFGTTYKTAEHWMMAQKANLFDDAEAEAAIIASETPAEAKELGRRVNNFDTTVWNAHRLNVVVAGNIYKFNAHRAMGDYLLQTGNSVLVEASPHDTIWGIGYDENNPNASQPTNWRGTNLLGFALMHTRDFLRQNGYFDPEDPMQDAPWFTLMGA